MGETKDCAEMLRKACREAKHVLTHAEVSLLADEGKIPRWATLQKQVGPWFLWSEMFNVPFLDTKKENAARKLRARYLEEEAERKAAAERFAAKQRQALA